MLHLLVGRTDIPAGTFAWGRGWVWLLWHSFKVTFFLSALLALQYIWNWQGKASSFLSSSDHLEHLLSWFCYSVWWDFCASAWHTMSKPQMCWGKTDWKGKTTSSYRISAQNVPEVPPRDNQVIAGVSYKRRETQIPVSVLPDGEQEPPLWKAVWKPRLSLDTLQEGFVSVCGKRL